jgi:hypothetical protein
MPASAANQLEVRVTLSDGGLDDDTVAEQAAMLCQELAQLDVDEVGSVAEGVAPPGTKGIELLALGGLFVKFARSHKILSQVVDSVRDWLTRNEAESVRMTIDGDVLEITGATTDERRVLIESWVQRHSEP